MICACWHRMKNETTVAVKAYLLQKKGQQVLRHQVTPTQVTNASAGFAAMDPIVKTQCLD